MCAKEQKNALYELANTFGNLYEQHDWKLIYPKYYCSTRWTGIHTSCLSIVNAMGPLTALKDRLIRDGYGHPHDDDDDEEEDYAEEEAVDGEDDGELLVVLDNTDTGNHVAAKSKQDRLLYKKVGVNDSNWGIDSMMTGMLIDLTVMTTRIQTTGQPIQHCLAREIRRMLRHIKGSFVFQEGSQEPIFPVVYQLQ